jgi:Na+-transporting NADH:ubiquinone oxidoreductase subunit F
MNQKKKNKYNLTEEHIDQATKQGLISATWYTTPIPREKMRELLTRRDGPAIRDTILWFAILFTSGILGYLLWGTWWAIIPFAIYGVIYKSSSDSRWHESLHGTAFKTAWMNNVLYEIASFMVVRESTPWRWSHICHHSDTIIVGRDPEIIVPRPPDIKGILLGFIAITTGPQEFRGMLLHAFGRLTPQECTYIPEQEYRKVFFKARIYLLIYAATVGLALYFGSMLPLMYIILPNFYGAWLTPIYGLTQHAGLAEDVLDHRLNCRTVYMNPIYRYVCWNMNYHMEHHMFPLVPYHALPQLHELVKHDSPPAYKNLLEAYREIIPVLLRQVKDPCYFIKRELPASSTPSAFETGQPGSSSQQSSEDGWLEVCPIDDLRKEDVLRYDHGDKTYAIYRTADDKYYATDGLCTHGNTHLADGLVIGNQIECPKHNGRFDIRDGSPQRKPICVGLKTYPVRINDGKLYLTHC